MEVMLISILKKEKKSKLQPQWGKSNHRIDFFQEFSSYLLCMQLHFLNITSNFDDQSAQNIKQRASKMSETEKLPPYFVQNKEISETLIKPFTVMYL